MNKMIIPLIAILLLLASCKTAFEPLSRTEIHLGTVVTITIYDRDAEKLLDGAMAEIERLERLLSKSIEESDVYRINASAGSSGTRVSDETLKVIEKGLIFFETSGGLFDISIGPLVDLWGIGTDDAKVPEQHEIDTARSLVGAWKIQIDGNRVGLPDKDMKIDLGGIAKGYIADQVVEYLRNNGCDAALINLGGNVLTLGKKPDGSKWRIGIQDPFSVTGSYMRIVEVDEMSVVTSGSYERFFVEDNITYHHIIDPRTGYPSDSDIAGVSIISRKSMDGDGLSTVVFAMGSEKGLALIEELAETECILILEDGEIIYSTGLYRYLD